MAQGARDVAQGAAGAAPAVPPPACSLVGPGPSHWAGACAQAMDWAAAAPQPPPAVPSEAQRPTASPSGAGRAPPSAAAGTFGGGVPPLAPGPLEAVSAAATAANMGGLMRTAAPAGPSPSSPPPACLYSCTGTFKLPCQGGIAVPTPAATANRRHSSQRGAGARRWSRRRRRRWRPARRATGASSSPLPACSCPPARASHQRPCALRGAAARCRHRTCGAPRGRSRIGSGRRRVGVGSSYLPALSLPWSPPGVSGGPAGRLVRPSTRGPPTCQCGGQPAAPRWLVTAAAAPGPGPAAARATPASAVAFGGCG